MALGRFDDARELLLRVRRAAEQGDDPKLLGMVTGSQASEDPRLPQRTLDDLLRRAWRRLNLRLTPRLAAWDPVLSAVDAAIAGDDTARRQAHLALDDLRESPG
ncbi:hypothetical protein ABZ871_36545 [Streptomyces populi]